jgi:hypothetical protein
MFNEKSRYQNTVKYNRTDKRGRTVTVTAVPDAPNQPILGYHQLKQGQRTDHLASKYTNDEAGFWRIAEANDAMLPEALTERAEIAIPIK